MELLDSVSNWAYFLGLILLINLRHINVVDENGKKPNIKYFFWLTSLTVFAVFVLPIYIFGMEWSLKMSIFDVETSELGVMPFMFFSIMAFLTWKGFKKPKEIAQKIKEKKKKKKRVKQEKERVKQEEAEKKEWAKKIKEQETAKKDQIEKLRLKEEREKIEIEKKYGSEMLKLFDKGEICIGMPLQLVEKIKGTAYDRKRQVTKDSVKEDYKYGRRKNRQGNYSYDLEIKYEDNLVISFRDL
ncbi:hypothetical protein OAP06_02855 [Gammaproteobacteria bacterium]|nr:hypothetical protein [Gammaproteobacteria bacterium]